MQNRRASKAPGWRGCWDGRWRRTRVASANERRQRLTAAQRRTNMTANCGMTAATAAEYPGACGAVPANRSSGAALKQRRANRGGAQTTAQTNKHGGAARQLRCFQAAKQKQAWRGRRQTAPGAGDGKRGVTCKRTNYRRLRFASDSVRGRRGKRRRGHLNETPIHRRQDIDGGKRYCFAWRQTGFNGVGLRRACSVAWRAAWRMETAEGRLAGRQSVGMQA